MSDDDSGEFEGTLFAAVGGRQFFVDLVDKFYDGIADDPILGPMYPDDTVEPRRRLSGFLVQYWGGPTTYSEERGHPRLRKRHMPFQVDEEARDAWLHRMSGALEQMTLSSDSRQAIWAHFTQSAEFLRNAE